MPSADTKPIQATSRAAVEPFDHMYDETLEDDPASVSSSQGPNPEIRVVNGAHLDDALMNALGDMREPLRRLVPLLASVLSEIRGLNARAHDSSPRDRGYWWLKYRVDDRLVSVGRRLDETWIAFENVVGIMDGLRRRAGAGRQVPTGSGNLIDCILHEMATPAACVRSQLYVAREDLRALLALGAGFRLGGNPLAFEELQQRLKELEEVLADSVQGAAHVLDVVQSAMLVGEPGAESVADLTTVIERVIRLLARRTGQAADIETELDPNLIVQARGSQVAQVLVNLVMNAVQAIESTARRGTIVVRAHRQGEYIICDVCDDGPGVNPANAHRIFEPYVTSKRGTGTGLGLAISLDIARSYGGDLQVTSIPGFTNFRLSLPPAHVTTMAVAS